MKLVYLSFLVIVLSVLNSFAQPPKGVIYWAEDRPLAWADFKGRAIKNSTYHAQTNGVLNYTFNNSGPGAYIFKLNVKFDKQKSWSKPKEQTDNLLNHEQGHFNIYEIYGRIIMKRVEESKALSGTKFSEQVGKIFKKAFDELQKFQREYDKETNHSKDEEKQKEWNKKLKDMLKELEDHKVKEIQFEITK